MVILSASLMLLARESFLLYDFTFFTSRLICWNKSNYSGVICSLNKELVGQTVCSLNCIESTVLGWEHSTVWGISAEWDNEREVVTTHFVNGLQENLWWKFRCEVQICWSAKWLKPNDPLWKLVSCPVRAVTPRVSAAGLYVQTVNWRLFCFKDNRGWW